MESSMPTIGREGRWMRVSGVAFSQKAIPFTAPLPVFHQVPYLGEKQSLSRSSPAEVQYCTYKNKKKTPF